MATVSDSISLIVKELLVPKIDQLMLENSPFFKEVLWDSRGVTNDPNVGRDWKVLRTFSTGLAGAVEYSTLTGPDMADVGSAPGYQAYSGVETWPGLGEQTAPQYVRKTITLKNMKFTMSVPLTVVRAAELGASIGDQMERTIKQTAMNVVFTKCNAAFTKVLGQFGSASYAGGTISKSGLSVTLNSGTSIRRFTTGQRVDIFVNGSNTRLNSSPVFVDVVDAFGTSGSPATTEGTIKLFHVGAVTTVLAINQTYDIVPRNSGRENSGNYTLPTSIDDVLIDTGSIYGVSVDSFPLLKSLIRDLSGAVLTESLLIKHASKYQHARGMMYGFDRLYASEGVWAAYFNNFDGYYQVQRNGALLDVKSGVKADVSFSLGGMNYSCRAEPWVPNGTVYGIKVSDGNWSHLTPPRIPGTGRNPMFDGGVEFIAPYINGTGSIFQGMRKVGGADAGATTDFLEAPAYHPYELVPEQICGMKLLNAQEFYG